MYHTDSLENFIHIVNAINQEWNCTCSTNNLWFRGHSRAEWNLTPKIYRSGYNSDYEREILRDFRLRSPAFLEMAPIDEFDMMFVMQHYSIPTRLLDWTESYLVALYFAVLDHKDINNGSVWVLDPWYLNLVSISRQSVPTTNSPVIHDYLLTDDSDRVIRMVKAELPAAIRARKNNRRIIAQRGSFTISGNSMESIDSYLNKKADARLKRIVIKGESKLKILKQLYNAGISHSVIFPELEGLCKEISFRYSDCYIGEHKSGTATEEVFKSNY